MKWNIACLPITLVPSLKLWCMKMFMDSTQQGQRCLHMLKSSDSTFLNHPSFVKRQAGTDNIHPEVAFQRWYKYLCTVALCVHGNQPQWEIYNDPSIHDRPVKGELQCHTTHSWLWNVSHILWVGLNNILGVVYIVNIVNIEEYCRIVQYWRILSALFRPTALPSSLAR